MLILRLLIFSLPWIAWPGREDPFLGPKQAVFLVGCWALLLTTWLSDRQEAVAQWRNPWTRRFGLYVLLFGAWRFWVPFLNRTPETEQVVYNWYIWESSLYILTGILVVHCLATAWLTSARRATQVTQWCCQSAAAVAVYVLFQRLGVEQFYVAASTDEALPFGGFGNTGIMASFLALTSPLFLLFHQRRYLVYLGLVLAAIWVSGARYAQVATVLSLLVYGGIRMAPRFRVWLRAVLVGGLVLGVVGLIPVAWQTLQADERYPIWKETMRLWKDADPQQQHYSWTGRGLETFPEFFHLGRADLSPAIRQALGGGRWHWAHNDWLQALFELGLFGVGFFALSLWTTATHGWAHRHTILGVGWLACGVSFVVLSLAYFPCHLAPTAFQGLLIWAMCECQELSG